MHWVQLDVEDILTGEYAAVLGMPPDEPPEDQAVAFEFGVNLNGTEQDMYSGLVSLHAFL